MKVRLTTLDKGEFFKLNGVKYEKMEKRERGNRCLNLSTGQIEEHPLMLYVEKVEIKRARKLPAPEPIAESPKDIEISAGLKEEISNKATIRLKRKQD